MAIRYAVVNGNWSNTATWDGGTLPGATDDVYANNFTVTIDQDITANSLRTDAGGSAVAGGLFTCATNRTIALQGLAVGAHTGSSQAILALTAGSAIVTVAGALTGDSSTTGSEPPALWVSGGTHTLVAGSVTGGSVTAAHTVLVTGGTLTASVTNAAGGTGIADAFAVSGGSLVLTASDVIRGGGGAPSYGVNVSSGSATIRGELRPGSASAAINGGPGGVLRYSGHAYSGGMAPSTGPNGFFPIAGSWSVIDGEEVYLHVFNDDNYPSGNNGTQTILTQYGTDNPDQSDVRDGVSYGPSGTLEGTLAVPPAASVAAGVPVDNTVGTAAVKLSDIAAVQGAQIAAATSA